MTIDQGCATSIVGGPELLKMFFADQIKRKKFFLGHSIFEKFNLEFRKIYITANV